MNTISTAGATPGHLALPLRNANHKAVQLVADLDLA
jgi:hypothetical protein